LTWLLSLQKSFLGGALRGHLWDCAGRFRLGYGGSLIQAALKVYNSRFEFLNAASLTVHRLEKAVECLPDNFLTHDSKTSRLSQDVSFLLFHT